MIRERGDNSGNLLGVAVVSSIADLFDTMDEYGNPSAFEYLRVSGTCVFMQGLPEFDSEWWGNSGLVEQIPATDLEIEYCNADGNDISKTPHDWKTMVELCGGQERFWRMYKSVYKTGTPVVAYMMGNHPDIFDDGGEA